jgi:hypothetical protein
VSAAAAWWSCHSKRHPTVVWQQKPSFETLLGMECLSGMILKYDLNREIDMELQNWEFNSSFNNRQIVVCVL